MGSLAIRNISLALPSQGLIVGWFHLHVDVALVRSFFLDVTSFHDVPPIYERRKLCLLEWLQLDSCATGTPTFSAADSVPAGANCTDEALKKTHQLWQAYVGAYLKQCDLEKRQFAINPTFGEQRAACLTDPTAGPKEGPMGIAKASTSRNRRAEEWFLRAMINGRAGYAKAIPQQWLAALPVDALAPYLRRIVRAYIRSAALRKRSRVERFMRDREGSSSPEEEGSVDDVPDAHATDCE
eukprot:gene8675-8708_t